MIQTNQLLHVALALLSNLTNVAPIDCRQLPERVEDFRRIVVGSPRSPIDLWLVAKSGQEFWITAGVVHQYESPDSFFHLQDLRGIDRLRGKAIMGSNQVLRIASDIVRRAAKTGNPAQQVQPIVKTTGNPDLPFFEINWPDTNRNRFSGLATVEIDARNGHAVYFQFLVDEYYDYPFASILSNQVYRPEPIPKSAVKVPRPASSIPTTNEIQRLIPIWLRFCQRFGLDPGNQTNIAQVNWDDTFKAPATESIGQGILYMVHFENDVSFGAVDDSVFLHVCADAYFGGAWAQKPPQFWKRMGAVPKFTWQDLCTALNNKLVQNFGVDRAYLKTFTPTPYAGSGDGVPRCVIRWYRTDELGKMPEDAVHAALWVEFDLSTGQVKVLRFDDAKILRPAAHPGQ